MEMELVNNRELILTKNAILAKAVHWLETLQDQISGFINTHHSSFPGEVRAIPPKISKGENYMGLPYRILDHPRYFQKEDTMAVRTLFWWGNFFSMTLHLSGKYKLQYEARIRSQYTMWKENDFFICINEDPWEHHFEKNNFVPVAQLEETEFGRHITEPSFLKLACLLPLQEWNEGSLKLFEHFKMMMGGMLDQLPSR